MRVNKRSLSYYVLTVLEKSIDTYVRFEDFTYNTHLYAFGNRWKQTLPRTALSKALSRLKYSKLIEEGDGDDGHLVYKLTSIGKEWVLENSQDESKWDGKWRIVIFDVPESKRLIRDMFRRNLKKMGFQPLQKSVWISKKDIYNKLLRYIEELGIGEWAVVLESERISFSKI